jgi:hypothetical protein
MPRTSESTGEGGGSGHKGPAKGFAFGVASVTRALHGVSFPISKADLIRKHGREEVNWTRDRSEGLGDILRDVDKEEFLSVTDVASSVSETHRNENTEDE